MLNVIRLRLREVREERGLTQLELAQRIDVRQATISDLETGKAKVLRFSLLDALCAELGVSPGELLERDEPPARRRRS